MAHIHTGRMAGRTVLVTAWRGWAMRAGQNGEGKPRNVYVPASTPSSAEPQPRNTARRGTCPTRVWNADARWSADVYSGRFSVWETGAFAEGKQCGQAWHEPVLAAYSPRI